MVCFKTLFLIVLLAQVMMVKTHTWFPDPKRAARVEARWNNYKAISYKNKTTVTAICGAIGHHRCSKPIGRPSDQESESCDRYCCHKGNLTGFCLGDVQITFERKSQPSLDKMEYRPSAKGHSNCLCTNDMIDAKCGPDASFMGIRCPDLSACQRMCCRQGKSGGHCGGFFRLKCICD